MKNGLIIICGLALVIMTVLFLKGIINVGNLQITYASSDNVEVKTNVISKSSNTITSNDSFNSLLNNQINMQVIMNDKKK